jgi:hypothetical protein
MTNPLRFSAVLCALQAGQLGAQTAPTLKFNGDFRVRYEYTNAGNGALALGREVVRFRLGLT